MKTERPSRIRTPFIPRARGASRRKASLRAQAQSNPIPSPPVFRNLTWRRLRLLLPPGKMVLSFSPFSPRGPSKMQNLFQPEAVSEVIARVDKLHPGSQREWGKMDVAQMMAHCSATLDVASGRVALPRMFIGRILGSFVRPVFTNDKPFFKERSHR